MLRRLARDRRGNVAMIFALTAIPLLFATAMGIDYGNNARRWSQMNAAADAAALAVVNQQLMYQTDAVARSVGQNMFNAQIAGMSSVVFNPATDLNIAIADTVTSAGLLRTATVNYSAKVDNVFAGILGQPTMSISGSAKASGAQPPNVNYYLLLDSSPSMGIAGTSADITRLSNAHISLENPGGCGFACHESNPPPCSVTNPDVCGNPKGAPGTPYANGIDNFQLAKSMIPPVMLRIDLVNAAVLALIQTAQQTQQLNQTYGISINTFDVGVRSAIPPIKPSPSIGATTDLTSAYEYISANPIQQLEVYDSWQNSPTDTTKNSDTNWDRAIGSINAAMPNPGNGTNLPGDTPQEVLFVVTDGVEEEWSNGGRVVSLMGASQCTAIKNRGIRIAVLYTEYLPLPTNPYYLATVALFPQPSIATDLQSCASPGLFFAATVDQDISAALVALFQATLPITRLSQ